MLCVTHLGHTSVSTNLRSNGIAIFLQSMQRCNVIMVEFGDLDGKKCLIALLVSSLQRLDEKWSI